MTPYQQAFLDLMHQRDTMYLQLLAVVVVGFSWYALWLKRMWKLCFAAGLFLFGAAWVWGLIQLLPKDI